MKMTALYLFRKYINKKAMVRVLYMVNTASEQKRKYGYRKGPTYVKREGLMIPVRIHNARVIWGKLSVLVTPYRGTGTLWVTVTDKSNIRVVDDWPEEGGPHAEQATLEELIV